jgi:hypothetical protein
MSAERDLPSPQRPEVVDPLNCQVAFADWIATAGCYENVVNITFGALDHAIPGSNGLARVIITSRMRFSRDVGLRIYDMLGNILGISPESAPSTPDPAPVPKNRLN